MLINQDVINQDNLNSLSGLGNYNLGNPIQPDWIGFGSQKFLTLTDETLINRWDHNIDSMPVLTYTPESVFQTVNIVNQAIYTNKHSLTGLVNNSQLDDISSVSLTLAPSTTYNINTSKNSDSFILSDSHTQSSSALDIDVVLVGSSQIGAGQSTTMQVQFSDPTAQARGILIKGFTGLTSGARLVAIPEEFWGGGTFEFQAAHTSFFGGDQTTSTFSAELLDQANIVSLTLTDTTYDEDTGDEPTITLLAQRGLSSGLIPVQVVPVVDANNQFGRWLSGTTNLPPTVTISATDANAAETATGITANPGKFTITRTGSTANSLTAYYTVAGTATNGTDYNNLTGSVVFAAGASTAVININPINDALVEPNETVILTLAANNAYTLGATKAATVIIADNDKPTITISATDANAAETATGITANPGKFTLTRTGSTTSSLTVNYTVSGTATKGTDYNNLTGSAVFAAGASTTVININPINDALVEPNETVILTLAANNAYTLGTTKAATVIIADNDKPTVIISATDANAAETATGIIANPGKFTLTRTGSTTSSLTVNYTVSGTATKGTDYNNLTGSAVFAAGASTTVININPINDALVEPNETVILTLAANNAYTLGTTKAATVIIADNDKPTITISATDANAAETATGITANPGKFTLTRTGSTTSSLTVNYTVSGTATKGTDYNNLTGSAVFAAGASTTVININPINDALVETNETVILNLTANSAYTLGATKAATVKIADNDSVNSLAEISNLSFSGKEGDIGTFGIRLSQAPTSNVTVTFNHGSFLTIDADNIIDNGTQKTLTFTPSNWNVNKTVRFIAEVDGSSANRTLGNTISYNLSGGKTGIGSYNLGTITNTYAPDNTKFNIDLDFRNDYLGFWTSARKTIAKKAVDDWAVRIADEFSAMTLNQSQIVTMQNPNNSNSDNSFDFTANRYVDDLVIFVGVFSQWDDASGLGNGWINYPESLPRYGMVVIDAKDSLTDSLLYEVFSHEIGHALAMLWAKPELIDYSNSSKPIFKGEYTRIANGGSYISLRDGVHPADNVNSIMSYGDLATAPTNIDFAMLADSGYRVYGFNA